MDLKISPAFAKNSGPIKETLESILPDSSVILEIGSGPGQHAIFFSQEIERVSMWYPTERSMHLEYIEQWRAAHNVPKVQPPQQVDLLTGPWWEAIETQQPIDMILSINVAHIVIWQGVVSLLEGASHLLKPGAMVYFYGPWRYNSRPLEPSNERFDLMIQERVEGGGLRVFEDLVEVAESFGFTLGEDREMPSNNRSIWFVRI